MKKLRLTAVTAASFSAITLAAMFVNATPLRAQGLEFSGGVNFSQLSGDAIQQAANTVGMNFGVDLVIPVGPIGLNLGGGWSQKGSETTAAGSKSVIDLSYIELPVHVRLPIVGAGPIRLNLIVGPTIGINTGCKVSIDTAAAQACEDLASGPKVKGLDWAGATGLGLSFRLGGIAYAGTDLTYTFGLTSVSDSASETFKNRAFSLDAHVGFDVF